MGSRDPGLNTIGYAGSVSITPRPVAHAIKKPKGLNWEYLIAAGNAGWRSQFRFAVHAGWSRVPELWTLGSVRIFMLRMLKSVVKFAIVMFAMMIVSTIVWQEVVVEYLYDCTDDNMMGFLRPGDWVHFYHGVVYVPHVTHDHSMSDPDSIKQGWSMTGLWGLWFSFVAVSLLASIFLARRRWIPGTHTLPNTY